MVRTSDNAVSGCVTTIRAVLRRVAELGECGPNFLKKKDSRRKWARRTRFYNLFFKITICCAGLVHPPVRESWLQTSAQAVSASLDSLSPRFALPHATMHHRDPQANRTQTLECGGPTPRDLEFRGKRRNELILENRNPSKSIEIHPNASKCIQTLCRRPRTDRSQTIQNDSVSVSV